MDRGHRCGTLLWICDGGGASAGKIYRLFDCGCFQESDDDHYDEWIDRENCNKKACNCTRNDHGWERTDVQNCRNLHCYAVNTTEDLACDLDIDDRFGF